MARITAWVKEQLAHLPEDVEDRVFLTYRTMADPRWLDPTLDPNDRVPNTCHLGEPRKANNLPTGLGRISTLRSWLSQWSAADSNADAVGHAARVSVPFLVVRNGADQACFPSDPDAVFAAVPHPDKQYVVVEGADHYYANQPGKLDEAAAVVEAWLRDHSLA
jgi:pimeloyl-ACP methyl ester carboxylesterase